MKTQQITESNEQHFLQRRSTQRSAGPNCAKLCKKTQEHSEPPQKPATPPETTASPTDNETSQRTQTSPDKSRANSRKLHFTEKQSKRTVENAKSPNKSQMNREQRLHQHTTTQKTTKTTKNSRCGWEQVLHGLTVGA